MRRALTVAAAAVLLLAAAALSGCGHAEFEGGSAPDVPRLVAKAGLVVLDEGSAENRYPGGTSGAWYVIGHEGSDEAEAVVSVLRFESRADRDSAFRQIMHRMGRRLPHVVVYTAGDAVIQVGRIGDLGVAQDLHDALQEAGAR
jgi:hypothetical protein